MNKKMKSIPEIDGNKRDRREEERCRRKEKITEKTKKTMRNEETTKEKGENRWHAIIEQVRSSELFEI